MHRSGVSSLCHMSMAAPISNLTDYLHISYDDSVCASPQNIVTRLFMNYEYVPSMIGISLQR
jgi:hypothetical protein